MTQTAPPSEADAGSCIAPELIAAARRVLAANRAAGRTIAVAESCTGGLVSTALTELPGSSDVFRAGFVTYANEAKIAMLGISPDLIDTFGAVSIASPGRWRRARWSAATPMLRWRSPAWRAPAADRTRSGRHRGIRARAARADPDDVIADLHQFGDLGRSAVRHQAALMALGLLLPSPDP